MSLVMYARVGHYGRWLSPFFWRIRYALAHTGVSVEFGLVRFAQVETIRGSSGQHMVRILCDGGRVIHDCSNTCYLEGRFPDRYARLGCSDEFVSEGLPHQDRVYRGEFCCRVLKRYRAIDHDPAFGFAPYRQIFAIITYIGEGVITDRPPNGSDLFRLRQIYFAIRGEYRVEDAKMIRHRGCNFSVGARRQYQITAGGGFRFQKQQQLLVVR